MLKGYTGKILRVDLTRQKIEDEELPGEGVLRKYVGGTVLGLKYLYDEAPTNVQPLDPESPLIFMTGPLVGTVWPCSSRHAIVNLYSDFPKSPGTSWGGGTWAAKLRWGGYDGIIVEGKAEKPMYLLVKDGKPSLHDASQLWGKETRDTEALIQKEIGDPQCSAACIGPAGERCLQASIIINEHVHVAGKGGGGQVMGSKLLKAIAVSGKGKPVALANIKQLTELALEYRQVIVNSPVMDMLSHGGLSTHYHAWPTDLTAYHNLADEDRNFEGRISWLEQFHNVVKASKVIPRPCFNCPIGCCQEIIVGEEGPYKGYHSGYSGGGGWEGMAGRTDVAGSAAIFLTDLGNRLGTDAAITGAKMGLLFECYEKGLIDKKFTDGLELKWGNADAAIKLLYKFVYQEGVGKILAKGQDEIAQIIGHGAEEFLEGCKGLAFHHDYRASWEVILAHALASCGVSPEGFGFDAFWPAMAQDFGYPGLLPRFDKDRAALAVRLTAIKNRWDNAIGVCQFSVYGTYPSLEYTVKAVNLAVGWDFDRDEALLVGDRAETLARVFNVRRGLTIDDDMHIGPRLLDGHKVGPYKDKPIRPHLKYMVQDFYSKNGWDSETGVPLESTLNRLGLDELIQDLTELKARRVEIHTSSTQEIQKEKGKKLKKKP